MRVIDEEKLWKGLGLFDVGSPEQTLYIRGLFVLPLSQDGWAGIGDVMGDVLSPSEIHSATQKLLESRLIETSTENGSLSIRWDYVIPYQQTKIYHVEQRDGIETEVFFVDEED